ncbi:hypothetical protein [Sporohalobacter salinus]|uniref:hypothetical protein n=1 Tax=Sporohalobacter salinus TaxID=1494606 RepID=UPI00196132FC|nr:hypothetical protein [Sporohalobacter salinus]MBM7624747.1 Holliday junction resolvase RusA-like endonuclease [Sporohalobacter salinus]
MNFPLIYKGKLKSNGGIKHKHEIRKQFHPQLKELWSQSPLKEIKKEHLQTDPNQNNNSIIQEIKEFKFAPLITDELYLIASLDITLLRPEEPGNIITNNGDIDNQLKTLFDALQCPDEQQIPNNAKLTSNRTPFFCLLKDDALITSVKVSCNRLLEYEDPSEVFLLIDITVNATQFTFSNAAIGSGY